MKTGDFDYDMDAGIAIKKSLVVALLRNKKNHAETDVVMISGHAFTLNRPLSEAIDWFSTDITDENEISRKPEEPASEAIRQQAEDFVNRSEIISREGKAFDKSASELQASQQPQQSHPSQQTE